MIKHLTLILFAALMAWSCKKEDPKPSTTYDVGVEGTFTGTLSAYFPESDKLISESIAYSSDGSRYYKSDFDGYIVDLNLTDFNLNSLPLSDSYMSMSFYVVEGSAKVTSQVQPIGVHTFLRDKKKYMIEYNSYDYGYDFYGRSSGVNETMTEEFDFSYIELTSIEFSPNKGILKADFNLYIIAEENSTGHPVNIINGKMSIPVYPSAATL